ncbi:MAG: DivIVA domain-containing protein [candidate division KSB1 bacterium]|nr:DivIVA domain-containing protein [candidate division KSB1 bacterium]
MKITPLDIKKQEFKKTLRGFDPVEVETFLEMVAEEYEALIRERNALADEVLKLKTQLRDYQEVERTFKESLMSAQQTIEQSRENSKREAELIIREAEMRAEKLLENAGLRLAEMKNELLLIKSQKESFAKRLKHLLESQLELIGVLEIDDLGLGELDEKVRTPEPRRRREKETSEEVQFAGVDETEEEPLEAQAAKRAPKMSPQFSKEITNPSEEKDIIQKNPFENTISSVVEQKNSGRMSDQFIL